MEGFVEDYQFSQSAVLLKTKRNDQVNETLIPVHGIVDITYTKGDTNIGFQEMTANSKSVKFKDKDKANKFFKELYKNWFEIGVDDSYCKVISN